VARNAGLHEKVADAFPVLKALPGATASSTLALLQFKAGHHARREYAESQRSGRARSERAFVNLRGAECHRIKRPFEKLKQSPPLTSQYKQIEASLLSFVNTTARVSAPRCPRTLDKFHVRCTLFKNRVCINQVSGQY
jgi:hypothetical protein